MITREELIEIIDHNIVIDIDENGDFQHNGKGYIWKGNKDPDFGIVEDFLVKLYIPEKVDKTFNDYDDLLNYEIEGDTVYNHLKDEDIDDICTRIIDDNPKNNLIKILNEPDF